MSVSPPRQYGICLLLACLLFALAQFGAQPGWKARADDNTPGSGADYAAIYRRVSPSVVSIEIEIGLFDDASGTGFVVDKLGHIVTNAHVVEDARNITVVFHDGSKATAEMVGFDPFEDIAVIKVHVSTNFLRPVTFGDSDALAVGQWALAIGNPYGLEGALTIGIISALHRDLELGDGTVMQDMIQTDAAINPGNSGGPLFNLSGEVVGINTLIRRSSNNLGFAIPSNRVKRISENMSARKHFRITNTPWLTLNRTVVARRIATPRLTWTLAPTSTGPTVTSTLVPTDTQTPSPHGADAPVLRSCSESSTPHPTLERDTPGRVTSKGMAAISLDVIGVDSTDLSRVSIYTSVLDASGQLISGLDVGNFSIGGDLAGLANVTRVENVTDDDLAFASVLVIDTSSSMADRPLRQAKRAAAQYVKSLRSNDPVAIVTFSTTVSLVVDYTTDRDLLLRAIDSLAYGGQTALYDATYLGTEIAKRAPLPHRAVVILSDGGEFGDVSARNRDESIKAATVNGVPVHTVGLGWSIDRRFLEVVSAETNAEFYDSPLPEQLLTIFQNLAHLFRTQYIITICADVPADGTRYDFSLEVTAPDGRYISGMATLRVPTLRLD